MIFTIFDTFIYLSPHFQILSEWSPLTITYLRMNFHPLFLISFLQLTIFCRCTSRLCLLSLGHRFCHTGLFTVTTRGCTLALIGHLESLEITWSHLKSLEVAWNHLNSLGVAWSRLKLWIETNMTNIIQHLATQTTHYKKTSLRPRRTSAPCWSGIQSVRSCRSNAGKSWEDK